MKKTDRHIDRQTRKTRNFIIFLRKGAEQSPIKSLNLALISYLDFLVSKPVNIKQDKIL